MNDDDRIRLTRRGFLAGTIAAAVAACSDADDDAAGSSTTPSPSSTEPSTTAAPPTTDATTATTTTTTTTTTASTTTTTTEPPSQGIETFPFTLGVASGDPLADSVVLWTRLVADEALPDDDLDVEWEIATDAAMVDIVHSGTTPAVAALGHSVHAVVDGLEADREYFYRFRIDGFETEPARTRTFAAPGTTPERFRFAFSSCQNWEQGYYAAYRDLVEQGDLDAFVFLGDYIYEYASGRYADEGARTTGQDFECETLDQYRQRYALYRSDPLLQAAHTLAPWIITWDDHEVDNDYAAASSEEDTERAAFLARRAAGYQAWYEHMPVRLPPPTGPDYEIFRSIGHGDLVRFHVLDTRQYRSDQQRGESMLPAVGDAVQVRDDEVALSPDQTMLGTAQRDWLIEQVESSPAVWDVMAQQVIMLGANLLGTPEQPVIVVDTWDGYARERRELLDRLGPATDNLIVLTGDFHSAAVGDVRADPFDATLPIVATEFMASSISSSFFDDDETVRSLADAALAANPHVQLFDTRRGYTVCEVTPDRWVATYRAVADQFDEASPVETLGSWAVDAGTPGAMRLA